MVQEYLRTFLAGVLCQYFLILSKRENLIIHQVGKYNTDVQFSQNLLSVVFEDLSSPSLLFPGAWPLARPLLLPLLLPHKPLLCAAAKHLQVEETHQNFCHGSVIAGPKGEEVHISSQ